MIIINQNMQDYHKPIFHTRMIIITPFSILHCKYIRPDYDGTLAIHRSSTMIPCRDQLQCKIWKFLIQNSII